VVDSNKYKQFRNKAAAANNSAVMVVATKVVVGQSKAAEVANKAVVKAEAAAVEIKVVARTKVVGIKVVEEVRTEVAAADKAVVDKGSSNLSTLINPYQPHQTLSTGTANHENNN
jgi:hypothetical protein